MLINGPRGAIINRYFMVTNKPKLSNEQEVEFVEFYKLFKVWLGELSFLIRDESGFLILKEIDAYDFLISEVPGYRAFSSGASYFDGTKKCVFNDNDFGKIFVTEKRHIPEDMLTDEEKATGTISEKRLVQLRGLIYSNTAF